MKNSKKILTIFVTLLAVVCLQSCDFEELRKQYENQETRLVDPKKDCPPNDRNCNGIPDDQE